MPMVMMSGWIAADALDADYLATGSASDATAFAQSSQFAGPFFPNLTPRSRMLRKC